VNQILTAQTVAWGYQQQHHQLQGCKECCKDTEGGLTLAWTDVCDIGTH
jgi:hypothetical protein